MTFLFNDMNDIPVSKYFNAQLIIIIEQCNNIAINSYIN